MPKEPFSLLNTLGKLEMEWAAELMLERIIKQRSWKVDFDLSDFEDGDTNHKRRTGFLWLLHQGWMDYGSVSPCFRVSPKLAEHLLKLRDVEPERRHLV